MRRDRFDVKDQTGGIAIQGTRIDQQCTSVKVSERFIHHRTRPKECSRNP